MGIGRTTATEAAVTAVPLGDPNGLYMWQPTIVNRRGDVIGSSGDSTPVVWSNGRLSEPLLPAAGSAYLEWINDAGQFVGGFRGVPDDKQTAIAWPEGIGGEGVVIEPRAEFRDSRAYLINNNGQVVYDAIGVDDYTRRCFVYDLNDGSRTEILPPAGHPGDVYPRGFNDAGQFVSSAYALGARTYVFFWEDGVATDLTQFGSGTVYHLNQSGQVLGSYAPPEADFYDRAFLWHDGALTDLGALGTFDVEITFTRQSLNDAGETIGTSDDGVRRIPFHHTGGAMTELPVPAGLEADPLGIAHTGDIAGRCGGPQDIVTSACLWRGGQFLDLGTPRGYNDAQGRLATEQGDVVAFASSARDNPTMSFLLTPA
ncbi:hypothetical protein [Streptomyces sp. B6B3]|uniref:hypothetical protein n=1 Tax=Streptomyces sp. B6B3 TaxID=3153570 RepID=UPI00325D05E6